MQQAKSPIHDRKKSTNQIQVILHMSVFVHHP